MSVVDRWKNSELGRALESVHSVVQLLVWTLGGLSIVVAMLTGVQLLPDTPLVELNLPDPREWISLEHPLYRWLLFGLGFVVASSALFALGGRLTRAAVTVRYEMALVIACMTALAALLIARGLTDLSFGQGWDLHPPGMGAGWDWLKDLYGSTLGEVLEGVWPWAAGVAYLGAVVVTLGRVQLRVPSWRTEGVYAGYSLRNLALVAFVLSPVILSFWVMIAWPLLRDGQNLSFYFALACAAYYAFRERQQGSGKDRGLVAGTVLLIWIVYWVVEATSKP
jgi:hypothetical protein